jgi:hypothetical protein
MTLGAMIGRVWGCALSLAKPPDGCLGLAVEFSKV